MEWGDTCLRGYYVVIKQLKIHIFTFYQFLELRLTLYNVVYIHVIRGGLTIWKLGH
ncbi:unnamed protein product [Staurois parvus]|uniref:Uncharacterized protein n=1 Tax=Staurois parvus TaxID=386267 RepID=A0ABN9DUF2_9NEOB|nr:unnamed protein product [Staurois parvus]